MLPIITHPNPILKQRSSEVEESQIRSPKIQRLISEMVETLREASNGIGLAAPQVGASLRVVIITVDESIMPLINPRIISRSWRKETDEEGCLSVPGVYLRIRRPASVKVEAFDQQGRKISLTARGLVAREIQHEVDHLDGILIIDKIKK